MVEPFPKGSRTSHQKEGCSPGCEDHKKQNPPVWRALGAKPETLRHTQHPEPPAVTQPLENCDQPGPGLLMFDAQTLPSRASGYLPQPGATHAPSTFSQPGPPLTPLSPPSVKKAKDPGSRLLVPSITATSTSSSITCLGPPPSVVPLLNSDTLP